MTEEDHGADGEPDADLLAAWALDAVDGDERRAIEQRLAADPGLRARADALNRTVGRLAASTPAAPPAELRDRVLGAVAATGTTTGEVAGVADLGQHRARRRPRRPRWWVTAASAAAAAVVAVGLLIAQPWTEPGGISEGEQATAIEQILRQDGAASLEAPVTGGGTVEAARAPNGETIVAARELPDPVEGRDYQLWTLRGEEPPRSGGLLEVWDGRALVRLTDLPADAALAVTMEPDGGSEAPTTEPIVVLAPG